MKYSIIVLTIIACLLTVKSEVKVENNLEGSDANPWTFCLVRKFMNPNGHQPTQYFNEPYYVVEFGKQSAFTDAKAPTLSEFDNEDFIYLEIWNNEGTKSYWLRRPEIYLDGISKYCPQSLNSDNEVGYRQSSVLWNFDESCNLPDDSDGSNRHSFTYNVRLFDNPAAASSFYTHLKLFQTEIQNIDGEFIVENVPGLNSIYLPRADNGLLNFGGILDNDIDDFGDLGDLFLMGDSVACFQNDFGGSDDCDDLC